jgi:two-component system, LytTR family, response regulator
MGLLPKIQICGRNRAFPNEIVWLEACVNYTIVHFRNGKKLLVAKTLKELESRFFEHNFFRIHRSYLVNMRYIKDFNPDEYSIQLTNNQLFVVSRRKMLGFKLHIQKGLIPNLYL